MPKVQTILLYACLLIFVFVLPACAKDVEIQAKGTMTVAVGVGKR